MGAFAPTPEAVARVQARIAASGYVTQIEAADGVEDYYLYTVGLTGRGKPELLFGGRRNDLPLAMAVEAVRMVAEFSVRGIGSVEGQFRGEDMEPDAVEALMGLAVAVYGKGRVRAVRLMTGASSERR